MAEPAFSTTFTLVVANWTTAGAAMPMSVVVVLVSPVLVTWSATGVVDPLKVSPVNVTNPALAVRVVVPPTVTPEPAGAATVT